MLYFNISSSSFFFFSFLFLWISQHEVITWQTGSVGQNKGLTTQRQQSREVEVGGGGWRRGKETLAATVTSQSSTRPAGRLCTDCLWFWQHLHSGDFLKNKFPSYYFLKINTPILQAVGWTAAVPLCHMLSGRMFCPHTHTANFKGPIMLNWPH